MSEKCRVGFCRLKKLRCRATAGHLQVCGTFNAKKSEKKNILDMNCDWEKIKLFFKYKNPGRKKSYTKIENVNFFILLQKLIKLVYICK